MTASAANTYGLGHWQGPSFTSIPPTMLPPDSISPFADKLGTNYVPSEAEIKDIRGLLIDPTEELGRIQAQIDEMEVFVCQLKAKHSSLKTAIDAHEALISPVRRAPDDVLREIFLACLPIEHNTLMDPSEAPILLGRICRHWRAVAHTTPMLWSSIYIPLPDLPDHDPSTRLEVVSWSLWNVVEQWFERSGTCPLTVSLSDSTEYAYEFDLDNHLVTLLLSVCNRLRHLSLSAETKVLLPLLCLGPEELPILKSLRIRSDDSVPFTDHQGVTNALQIPSLMDISLRVTADPRSLPLKWSQLTGLTLECQPVWRANGDKEGLDGIGALQVLRWCPNLLRCELQITNWDDIGLASNTSLITLPHLHTLVFRGPCQFPRWIPYLAVPKLRCLQVGSVQVTARFRDTPVEEAGMRVELETGRFTSDSLLELLRAFPAISHLHLYSDFFSAGKALLALDHLALPHNLCPILTHAVLALGPGPSDAAILQFIGARMAAPTPLQLFEAHFRREMETDIMPGLQTFISDGLQVSLNYREVSRWKFDARAGLTEPE
ncbi:hypothetical protein DFH08DRAFT_854886 [Mycena albidolilacea]|uniref:F-box domain-containing protein n=1 Tax=Mycena albidolilacea TaxID=1033008 RepID=A0AAD7ABQ5_9AGAR|nr:hypothetical protein DFH08DRAFT_854886 [Mycena albidolilacea]